ncbi:MAG: signal peptide peptidase SppA, type [Schlesneria sp.]|nr:signal peptide peptidase SppA, type [Schlesneria sp.]
MNDSKTFTSSANGGGSQTIIVQPSSIWRSWGARLLLGALGLSVLFNIGLFGAYHEYYATTDPPHERFHSGDEFASDKIAVLSCEGTIMPPFTERLIKQIDHVIKDDKVKGVLLVVDSPGGLVADSHEIYHRLKKLEEKGKPIYVQMKRMAASGGYYIAMGAGVDGRIYAEPTTWTGSIGVIIPHYDVSQLADKFGIHSEPLKTGEFKDALSPFRPLTEGEHKLWANILDQSFQKFIKVIDENRKDLDADAVKVLATGQIYTADDAVANKLVDEIGYEEDALAALKTKLGLTKARVVSYQSQTTLVEQLLGSMQAKQPVDPWRIVVEASVPRAMYLCSWMPALPR